MSRLVLAHVCGALLFFACGPSEGSVGVVCLKDCDAAIAAPDDKIPAQDAAPGEAPRDPSTTREPTAQRTAAACGARPLALERRELAIYLAIDVSVGMLYWWDALVEGFKRFTTDPASSGLNVGIGFYGAACDVATYAEPSVAFAALPGHSTALLAGFPVEPDSLKSGAVPALTGAHEYTRKWAIKHPGQEVVVLLVTNSVDDDCQGSIAEVSRVAQESLQAEVSVPTWVLALSTHELDPIAKAGGSGTALFAEGLDANVVLQRLGEFRDAVRPAEGPACRLQLPAADAIDVSRARLRVAQRDGAEWDLAPVADRAGCDAIGGGFYQPAESDDSIVVCPSSCIDLRDATKVDLLSECPGAAP